MMQAESSTPAAPGGGRWRRFLNKIGIGRNRTPGQNAAAQPLVAPQQTPQQTPAGVYPSYGAPQTQAWEMDAAQQQYLQQVQQQSQGQPQWPSHPQGFANPGATQFPAQQTGWQQSLSPQQAGWQQQSLSPQQMAAMQAQAPQVVAPAQVAPQQVAPQPVVPQAAPQESAPQPLAPQAAAPPVVAEPVTETAAPAEESAEQPEQQKLVMATLAGLAMRDLTLVESMIEIVEDLEDSSEDPEILDKLFKIDNLATRMRRNGENLLVLAGEESGDPSTEPVPLLDVARAAISEISDYQRVHLGKLPELFITGTSADDLSHLLAELMDNATEKSPDHAQVVISAQALPDGRLLITVEDEGIGIPPEQLAAYNGRLHGEPVLDEDVMRHMGLYVVSRIAHRYGFEVQLERRAFRGVSAHVAVPAEHYDRTGPSPAPEAPSRAMSLGAGAGPSAPSFQRSATAPREQASRMDQPAHSPRPQENSSAMDSSESSPVTAAGLPRRSAHRNTNPVPMVPPEQPESVKDESPNGEKPEEQPSDGGVSRAERIRADLEGFVEGQEEAARADD